MRKSQFGWNWERINFEIFRWSFVTGDNLNLSVFGLEQFMCAIERFKVKFVKKTNVRSSARSTQCDEQCLRIKQIDIVFAEFIHRNHAHARECFQLDVLGKILIRNSSSKERCALSPNTVPSEQWVALVSIVFILFIFCCLIKTKQRRVRHEIRCSQQLAIKHIFLHAFALSRIGNEDIPLGERVRVSEAKVAVVYLFGKRVAVKNDKIYFHKSKTKCCLPFARIHMNNSLTRTRAEQ